MLHEDLPYAIALVLIEQIDLQNTVVTDNET